MSKEAVLIVDHGSRKQAANDMIFSVVKACQEKLDTHIVVGIGYGTGRNLYFRWI